MRVVWLVKLWAEIFCFWRDCGFGLFQLILHWLCFCSEFNGTELFGVYYRILLIEN